MEDISNYPGRGIRTAQRYEREAELPVRRPAGGNSGSVFATKAELDAWLEASPLRHTFVLSQKPVDGYVVAFEALKKSIAEQRQLREELKELREELERSVELLRASVRFVQTDVHEEIPQLRGGRPVAFRKRASKGPLIFSINRRSDGFHFSGILMRNWSIILGRVPVASRLYG
jgi:hypothetical protein